MATQINSWNNTHDEHYGSVTFQEVSTINAKRASRWHSGFPNHEDGWIGADWSNAAQGEGGEMLDALQALLLANGAAAHLGLAGNVVKKLRRLDTHLQQAEQGAEKDGAYMATLKQKLATEIGDTFIYLDLLATFYELSMERCVVDTFNRVSEREGFPDKING
jgi:uncharacterized protein YabN with tetrapyrrole methylase and pyrophosphatase domain